MGWQKQKSVQIHGKKLEFFDKADLLHLPTRKKTSKKPFQPPLENSKIVAPVAKTFLRVFSSPPKKKTMKKKTVTFHWILVV